MFNQQIMSIIIPLLLIIIMGKLSLMLLSYEEGKLNRPINQMGYHVDPKPHGWVEDDSFEGLYYKDEYVLIIHRFGFDLYLGIDRDKESAECIQLYTSRKPLQNIDLKAIDNRIRIDKNENKHRLNKNNKL